jgi:7-keto-8-aminopelargonate synthetase-like enzyme
MSKIRVSELSRRIDAELAALASQDQLRRLGAVDDLAALAAFLRKQLREAGFDIGRGDTQVVPIFLGDNGRAVRFAALLNEAGFGVRPIRPPSVPAGTSRLRISLNAKLSTDLLARFTDALVSMREQEQVPVHAVRL